MFYVQDMKLINDTLTSEAFVEILNSDDPKVTDEYGSVNLELEVCLLHDAMQGWPMPSCGVRPSVY